MVAVAVVCEMDGQDKLLNGEVGTPVLLFTKRYLFWGEGKKISTRVVPFFKRETYVGVVEDIIIVAIAETETEGEMVASHKVVSRLGLEITQRDFRRSFEWTIEYVGDNSVEAAIEVDVEAVGCTVVDLLGSVGALREVGLDMAALPMFPHILSVTDETFN